MNMRNYILFFVFIFAIAGCGSPKTATETAIPVGELRAEYLQSKDATKAKYSGKTIIVKGWVGSSPLMPKGPTETGYLSLSQKGGDLMFMLSCQFSDADKAAFAKITADSIVTVSGVFEDDMSVALKSCKVVTE
ncbi:MAG TPA: hypothetical protein PLP07_06160 [Pyrinomonadaceae bacterium]|jgi:hypothetical protein|nr:hypothetical protein [Chloracidobacterium sp.]HQX55491.1 hypothetical protein [Pyrinomonadaceae bacterium]